MASLVLVLGLSFSSAQGTTTVDLVWTSSSSGASGLGTSSAQTSVGDTLTLSVYIRVDSAGLAAYATTFSWTPGTLFHTDTNVLDGGNGYQVTGNGPVSNAAGTATGQLAGSFIFGSVGGPSTIHQGDMTFIATGANMTAVINAVATGFDGIANGAQQMYTGSTVFNSASVNIVPEPGTAALLALGLGALTVAGRRRKA
jgi:hypothetical protein